MPPPLTPTPVAVIPAPASTGAKLEPPSQSVFVALPDPIAPLPPSSAPLAPIPAAGNGCGRAGA